MKNIMKNPFTSEYDFKVWLGYEINKLGFDVYIDKNISNLPTLGLPTFHGDKQKPDILVFFKENRKENKQININSPLALETKNITKENKFSNISHSIIQIDRYFGKKYHTDSWEGEIKNIILSTPHSITREHVFEWINGTEVFHDGVDWAVRHILWSISNKSGILKRNGKYFYIEFHNSSFYLAKGGYLDSKWKVKEW